MITSFTFNGIDVPIVDVNYCPEPSFGVDLGYLRCASQTVSFETTIPYAGGFAAFAEMLRNDPPGASPKTLVRRVAYGGRKGRSALRRLFARALPIEIATEHMRMRGRCVMLSEVDLHIKASSRRS